MDLALSISLLVGMAGALAALYGRYRTLPPFLTGPRTCKLEAGGCQALFRTPTAALLGIPNSLLGVFFYPALALGLLLRLPGAVLLGAATLAFAMTLYLAWWLIREKLECRVCWAGHLCNTVIWLVLLERLLM